MAEDGRFSPSTVRNHILLVDPDPAFRSQLHQHLVAMDYAVGVAEGAREAVRLLALEPFDMLLLDESLNPQHELELVAVARALQPDLILIATTAEPTLAGALAALRAEAAAYLVKPLPNHEILVAIQHALNRQATRLARAAHHARVQPQADDGLLRLEWLTLDRNQRRVTLIHDGEHTVQLSKGEAAVLTGLVIRAEEVLSCRELVRIVWGYELTSSEAESIIRPYICRLRRKLQRKPAQPQLIYTVRERGYLLSPRVPSALMEL